jgi:hypothetical protein
MATSFNMPVCLVIYLKRLGNVSEALSAQLLVIVLRTLTNHRNLSAPENFYILWFKLGEKIYRKYRILHAHSPSNRGASP